jgi:hypothetical protein
MVRGGPRGRGRGGHMKHRPPFIPHVPFDVVLAEPAFPPMKPPKEGNLIFNLTYLGYILAFQDTFKSRSINQLFLSFKMLQIHFKMPWTRKTKT